jgi:hypothetical protein
LLKNVGLNTLVTSHVVTQTGIASGRAGLLGELFNVETTAAREESGCSAAELLGAFVPQPETSSTNIAATCTSKTHVPFMAEIFASAHNFTVPL